MNLSEFHGFLLVALALLLLPAAVEAQEVHPRLEVASQFTYLSLQSAGSEPAGGVGGRVTWNPHRNVGLEAELNFFPQGRTFPSSGQGGRGLQGLFGVKSGWRNPKWGLYGKARAGFLSFSDVLKQIDFDPVPSITMGRLTEPTLDLGVVVEAYPWKRVSLRYDFGDTIVFYRARSLGNAVPPFPGLTVHSFQFSSSVVFRF